MAFATVSELAARTGRELSASEQAQAAVLLEDAATLLESLVTVDANDDLQAANLKRISCAMVQRAMASGSSSTYGIDGATATMGPFSQRVSFANPTGELYVSKAERASLGIGSATIGSIRAHADLRTVRNGHR